MTFATTEELTAYLGRDLSEREADTADLVLEVASGMVRAYTGQQFQAGTTTEWLWCRSGTVLLPQMPVTAVVSVTIDDEPVEYRLLPAGIVRLNRWRHNEPVLVEYEHGGDIPAPVRAACLQIAARALRNPDAVRQRTQTAGPFTEAVTYAETGSGVTGGINLSQAEKEALDVYRMPA